MVGGEVARPAAPGPATGLPSTAAAGKPRRPARWERGERGCHPMARLFHPLAGRCCYLSRGRRGELAHASRPARPARTGAVDGQPIRRLEARWKPGLRHAGESRSMAGNREHRSILVIFFSVPLLLFTDLLYC